MVNTQLFVQRDIFQGIVSQPWYSLWTACTDTESVELLQAHAHSTVALANEIRQAWKFTGFKNNKHFDVASIHVGV